FTHRTEIDAQAVANRVIYTAREGTQTYTVITVDDEAMIKRTIGKLLESTGSFRSVGEAEDGAEAMQLIERLRPDVVITDITMPVMDGLELIAACSGKQDGPEFIIVSGYGDFSYVQEAIRNGVADYLLKPI